jgi:hypothetical protein
MNKLVKGNLTAVYGFMIFQHHSDFVNSIMKRYENKKFYVNIY